MYYIGVRDGKKEKGGNINLSSFVYLQYTWPLSKCTQNMIEAEKFVTENLLGEKEKWINKGNNKQQHPDSLLHNKISHTQHLYQISKS